MKFARKKIVAFIACVATLSLSVDVVGQETPDAVIARTLAEPFLRSDIERTLWHTIVKTPPSQFESNMPEDLTDADLIHALERWLNADDVANSSLTRQLIYQFVATTHLRNSEEGIVLLIAGMNDSEATIRDICAKALIHGDTPAIKEVDSALASYLRSDSTTENDRAILLKLMMTRQVEIGTAVLSLLELRVPSAAQGLEVFWVAYLLMEKKGASIVTDLLDNVEDSLKVQELIRAISAYGGSTGGSFDTTPEVRLEIRTAYLELLQNPDPDIRLAAARSVLSQLGPTPRSTSKDQLDVNASVLDAVTEMHERETDPEIRKVLEGYVLLAFGPDGTLKSKGQWRNDMARFAD